MPLLESSESGETQEACKTLPGTLHSNHHSTAEPLYRWLPQPPFASSYLPCHSTSPHLFYNLPHAPSSLITVLVPCRFHCSPLPLPSFVLIFQLKQSRGIVQQRKPNPALLQQFQKDVSSFFEAEAGPPTYSFQTAAAAAAALYADCSQRTDI